MQALKSYARRPESQRFASSMQATASLFNWNVADLASRPRSVMFSVRNGGLQQANGLYRANKSAASVHANGAGCILYKCPDCGCPAPGKSSCRTGWGIACDGLATYTTRGCDDELPTTCVWFAKASRKGREPVPSISFTKPERELRLQQRVDAEGWRLLAQLIAREARTATVGDVLSKAAADPRPSINVTPACLLDGRSVLFAGDSTMRKLYAAVLGRADGVGGREVWDDHRAEDGLIVQAHGCEPSIGSGCDDCWACVSCSPEQRCAGAERGSQGSQQEVSEHGHSYTPWRKRLQSADYTRRGWLDYTHRHAGRRATLTFSWKPEILTQADRAAFGTRFCASALAISPPQLVYLGKGLHDACRHNGTDPNAFETWVASRLRGLASLLRCLPSSSVVVLRTPSYVPSRPGLAATRVCLNQHDEPGRVLIVRDVMLRLHRGGEFGSHALLLDMHALQRAATDAATPTLQTVDGHHYPHAFEELETALLWHAYALALDEAGQPLCIDSTTPQRREPPSQAPLREGDAQHADRAEAAAAVIGQVAAVVPTPQTVVVAAGAARVAGAAAGAMSPPLPGSVCVVLISAAPHALLLPRVVRSVLAQTLRPAQLVITLSGSSEVTCNATRLALASVLDAERPEGGSLGGGLGGGLGDSWRRARRHDESGYGPPLDWQLLCSASARSSGQNRNAASAVCRTFGAADGFISFMDSDDFMLPTRLATITRLMDGHNATIGLHSWLAADGRPAPGCCPEPPVIITPEEARAHFLELHMHAGHRCTSPHFTAGCAVRPTNPPSPLRTACRVRDACSSSKCAHDSSCIHFLPKSLRHVHYAHATVRGSVFATLSQRPPPVYGKVEDSWFVRDAAAMGMRVLFTLQALSVYNRSSGHIQPPGLRGHKATNSARALRSLGP